MTDRELLELAAKAAGVSPVIVSHELKRIWDDKLQMWMRSWNPLTDDGDALRLAVTLAEQYPQFHQITWNWTGRGVRVFAAGSEGEGHDLSAATRRAIVRAAAEIGKAMP